MEAFVGILVETLNSMIRKECGLLCGVATDMQKLSNLLSTTKAVLEEAEQKQFTDRAIQLWLQRLHGVASEIDDVLDDYAAEASRVKYKNSGCFSSMFYLVAGNLVFRHRIGTRMKEILEKFNAIADEQKKLGLNDPKVGNNHFQVDSAATRETGALPNEPNLVLGRDEERDKIVEILVNQVRDKENVSVLPIVGIGGLGKTTLAQLVFNDKRVIDHFELKLWVWVSKDFYVKRVIKALINSIQETSAKPLELDNSIQETSAEPLELDTLQRKLQKLLRGKRYLVVLDDVWNEGQEEWEKLKSILACGSKGSAVVTTTRMDMVATIMGTLQSHHLSSLPDILCWSLFRQRAFGPQNEEEYPKLVDIGKEIVKKCGGVPLAAKALGGFLRFTREETKWNFVKCSEIWNLPQDKTHILPALKLSYLNLPVELRGCFAYCAVFPKGYKIKKEEVIHLWMAHGLISSNGTMEVEDVGDAVLTELHYRSLFEAEKKDKFGRVLTFKMHDLVHDLAQSVMEAKHGGTESNSTIRYLTLDLPGDQPTVAFPIRRIRGTDQYSSFLSRYGSLRAFIARSKWCGEMLIGLLPTISNLKHLRYLNLSGSNIVELPNSICDLWNLQILNLNHCQELRSLPKDMRFLRNLRHLCLGECKRLTHMPSGIGKLTCLQTLSMVVPSGKEGFRLSELRDLNNLRGVLKIRHLERTEDKKEAEEANLIAKQGLSKLYLEWDLERMLQVRHNDEEVLEALKPCPNLQFLCIKGFKGSSLFPSWISTITNVVVYDSATEYIDGAQESATIAAIRSPSLKLLELRHMPNLKGILGREVQCTTTTSVSTPAGVFSRLQCLSFMDCPALTLLLPRMPSLEKLKVKECPLNMAWASISNLTSLNSLTIDGVEELSCFPEEMLQNLSLLESLEISRMGDLQALPSRSLASLMALKELTIKNCPQLKSLPEEGLQGLASMEKLRLIECYNLVSLSMGTKALKSLTYLHISGSYATALPEEFKHFSALQKLELLKFPNLSSLPDWFGDHFTSLQHLSIRHCRKLETLPSSIQMMKTLQSLDIHSCNLLVGSEWHKIKHIPHVSIKNRWYNTITHRGPAYSCIT